MSDTWKYWREWMISAIMTLCLLLGSLLITAPTIPDYGITGDVQETWWFDNDTHSVNGWTSEYNLTAMGCPSTWSYKDSSILGQDDSGTLTVYLAVEVYVAFDDETEKILTDDAHDDIQVSTSSTSNSEQSDTWAYGSSITLNTTDAIGYKTYVKGSASWYALENFITVELGAGLINSTTWTFYLNIQKIRTYNAKTGHWDAKIRLNWASASYDTRTTNVEVNYASGLTFSDGAHNATQARAPCEFSLKATGGTYNVAGYIFETNTTGFLVNTTWTSSGDAAEAWLNETGTVYFINGTCVYYRWFANDTGSNWFVSDQYSLTTTDSSFSYTLQIDNFTGDVDDWAKTGTTPYLHNYEGSSYISDDSSSSEDESAWYEFEDLDYVDSHYLIGLVNMTVTGSITANGGADAIRAVYNLANDTEYTHVLSFATDGAWHNATVTLPGWWTAWEVSNLAIMFKANVDYTPPTRKVDYVELSVECWNRDRLYSQLIYDAVSRKVNSTFPYAQVYNEHTDTMTDQAVVEYIHGASIYKLMDNNTAFLDLAYEFADWLADGQQICRLFQWYDVGTNLWNDNEYLSPTTAAINLIGLCVLVNVNSSYSSLLESAVQNYTDIFVVSESKRCKGRAFVNGTAEENFVYADYHAWATITTMYAGVALDSNTWKNFAYDMVFAYNLTDVNLPPHAIYTSDGHPALNYTKEDQTFGHILLSAEFVYAYKATSNLKNRIGDMAWQGAKSFWYPSNKRFIYMANSTTGDYHNIQTVHGFGWIDEALVQAYLIWENTTWLSRALSDWTQCVIDGDMIYNDLIVHSIQSTGAMETYWMDSTDYWNVMAKRVAQIFYNLNVTGYYHNATFSSYYEFLFGGTANGHRVDAVYGWVQAVDTRDFTTWDSDSGVSISLSLMFRNFQTKSVTINTFADLYSEFGNPFTGEESSVALPSILNSGWNDVEPWPEDVSKTLGQINSSLIDDEISWTLVVLEFANGTQVSFIYEYSWNAAIAVESTSDTLWIFCSDEGSWYHNY